MTNTNNCTNQQIIDWHFRTVCRYQLAEMPAAVDLANLFKNIVNKNKSDTNILESQRIQIRPQLVLTPYQRAEERVRTERQHLKTSPSAWQRRRPYANHIQFWKHISKITLHITSGKLLSNIERYPSFYMAFCCFGNQGPQIIRSKRAVAEFSVIKGAIIGARSNLQTQNKVYFLYKWAFIAAGSPLIKCFSNHGSDWSFPRSKPLGATGGLVGCLGVRNVFIFPELDKYNYYLFEPMGGFDLTFNIQNKTPKKF